MIFNSIPFVIFFLVFYIIYLLIRNRTSKTYLILIASYFFYAWWDWRFLSLIIFSTIVDYFLGKKIYGSESIKEKKQFLFLSLISNLGLLFIFKYFNFFIGSFTEIASYIGFSTSYNTLNIILPVGISFYTFQTMSYTIDIYKNKLRPENNFAVFASYVAFFPQLMAGPIVRAIDLIPQFNRDNKLTFNHFKIGVFLIVLGYFKKLVVADSIAPLVDEAFANPANYNALNLSIIVVFYSFQIYCDFSGYSDIAIGVAKLLGFEFPKNFNLPYFSKNLSEFWRRWHISLSSWLRDYLYISLGGNRNGIIFTQRNLMLTMLLGGLWHGANWTFVIWGFLHGSYLIVQRIIQPVSRFLSSILPKLLFSVTSIFITFLLVNIAWVFFRSQSVSQAFEILHKIFSFNDVSIAALKPKFQILKIIVILVILVSGELVYYLFEKRIKQWVSKYQYLPFGVCIVLLWLILFFGTFSSNNFIYFQF